MCKFTNRLFVFVLLPLTLAGVMAKPVKPISVHPGATSSLRSDLLDFFINDDSDDYGYQHDEIHYDQRQKGEENLQIRLDGFLIDAPTWDDYSTLFSMMSIPNNMHDFQIDHMKSQSTLDSNLNQLYQTESPSASETASDAQIVNIPAPRKDIESRQHGTTNDEPSGSRRTKAHLLQLLQMFRRAQHVNA